MKFQRSKTNVTKTLVAFLLFCVLAPSMAPTIAYAADPPATAAPTTNGCTLDFSSFSSFVNNGTGLVRTATLPLGIVGKLTWTPTYKDANGQPCTPPPVPTSCSGFVNFWNSPLICIGRFIGVIIATLLISASAFLLELAGLIFNWLVDHTIVAFGTFYTDNVKSAVETAWAAFRDIANILIIGIFTFIAVGTIVGLQQYNAKKMLARVLIIAVLINFSLLFTKVLVDASNFLAKQVYDAAGLQTGATTPNGSPAQISDTGAVLNYSQAGISGTFINLMGVASIGQTYKTLDAAADRINNGWIAFVHGLFSATLLLAAALVLLYGSFIVLGRAILLVFLMLTSSLAFASYLVPAWQKSHYGWDVWWGSLLRSITLAPVMLGLLWVSLTVANAIRPSGGTLGALLTDPANQANLNSFFIYAFVLGLLYISFRLSNSFAKKIAGFQLASSLGISPLTLANRFLAAPAMRLGVGGLSYLGAKSFGKQAKGARDRMGAANLAADRAGQRISAASEEAAKQRSLRGAHLDLATDAKRRGDIDERRRQLQLARQASREAGRQAGNEQTAAAEQARQKEEAEKAKKESAQAIGKQALLGKVADSKFNVADTSPVKEALKAVGVSGFAAGASGKGFYEKSYAAQVKERAEAAEKAAAKIAPSAEQNDTTRKKEEKRIRDQRQAQEDQLKATVRGAEVTRDTLKAPLDELLKTQQANLKGAEKIRDDRQQEYSAKIAAEREKLVHDDSEYAQMKAEIEDAEREKTGTNTRYDAAAASLRQLIESASNPSERMARESDLRASEERRASELRHQTDRIKTAQAEVQNFESTNLAAQELHRLQKERNQWSRGDEAAVELASQEVTKVKTQVEALEQPVKDAAEALKDYQDETKKAAEAAGKNAVASLGEAAAEIAERVGQKQGDILKRAYGTISGQNKFVGEEAKDVYKRKTRDARSKRVLEDLLSTETPAATPPAGGGTGHP